MGSLQRDGTGSRHHLVAGIDIVFQDNGYAMQGAPGSFCFSFIVQTFGNGQGIRVDFDDSIDLAVEGSNSVQIKTARSMLSSK